MAKNKAKIFIAASLWLTCLCGVLGLKRGDKSIGVSHAISNFREGSTAFRTSSLELIHSLYLLDSSKASVIHAQQALAKSRMDYKRIEFFMDYFFESSSLIYNRPAKVEVDEPYMEYQEPSGFQVMEVLLFEDRPFLHKAGLIEQADLLASSAEDLNSQLYKFEGTDKEILESIRLELIRVITLSITGYDAPELKTGIVESWQSLSAIQKILEPYLQTYPARGAKLSVILNHTLTYLRLNPDFDTFNRMEFLTHYALPLQEQLGSFIAGTQLFINNKSVLNYGAKNIFSPDAIPTEVFIGMNATSNSKVALGKKLFMEKTLSGDMRRSCASCHHPDRYFSEGLKTSLAIGDSTYVQRNAPTLFYAGFQYAQFWDGRVKTLPEQIKAVIANPSEMNGVHNVIIQNLRKNRAYVTAFQNAFPAPEMDNASKADSALKPNAAINTGPVNMQNLSKALAAYIMGLAPRNSAFDRYIAGDKKAMDQQQLKGFNLFMGKGQCGSCHFAPLFNGLIPPLYKRTEYENLGMSTNDDFTNLQKDTDKGRFGYFPISYYDGAFKTPSVRNSENTGPYMHNGAFKDLEKVVEFYNQGGGTGLHLTTPQQTLSVKPLNLSVKEVHQIVAFIHSLTDN